MFFFNDLKLLICEFAFILVDLYSFLIAQPPFTLPLCHGTGRNEESLKRHLCLSQLYYQTIETMYQTGNFLLGEGRDMNKRACFLFGRDVKEF